MRYVGWDTETHLITDAEPIPRCVVHSFYDPIEPVAPNYLEIGSGMIRYYLQGASAGELVLVAHNAAFDLAVTMRTWPELIPLVFDALDAGGVICTQRQHELHSLHVSGQVPAKRDLATVAKKFAKLELSKGADTWRLRYSELDGVPLDMWPAEATRYALLDAEAVFHVARNMPMSPDTANQTRYSLAFYLMSAWGMRVDPALLREERTRLEGEQEALLGTAMRTGYVRPNGTRDMAAIREAVAAALPTAPRTATNEVKTDRLTLAMMPPEHPVRLVDEIKKTEKLLSYLDSYQDAADAGLPIHPRVNVLLNTGRTSMSKPNLQQLPRKGKLRELFVARPGTVFANADLGTAELRSLGQACLDTVGYSRMAELFQRDPRADPHQAFADAMRGERQHAKAANFGFPGGMGAQKFIDAQRQVGGQYTLEEAQRLKTAYMMQWPEMRDYFAWVTRVCDGSGEVTLPVSGRTRGKVTFCNGANTGFQGRTADVAKYWCYLIVKESLTCKTSPLWGCRLVNFIHDEVIVECPESYAHEAALRVCQLAEIAGSYHVPDVPTVSDPALMRRWYKGAEAVYDGERLVPWQPES